MSGDKQIKGKESGKQAKPTQKQFDEAFDNLSKFLFEQYRKYKEEV